MYTLKKTKTENHRRRRHKGKGAKGKAEGKFYYEKKKFCSRETVTYIYAWMFFV